MRRSFVIPTSIALTMLSASPAVAQFGGARGRSSAPPTAGVPTPARVAGFNVVLVLASQQTDLSSDGIPASASKALADLKDFLPYRSYKLLDTQWSVGSTQLTRLRGVGNVEYSLAMDANGSIPTRVTVSRFVLRNAAQLMPRSAVDATVVGGRGIQESSERVELGRRLTEARQRYNADSPVVKDLEMRMRALAAVAEARATPRAVAVFTDEIINTSFTMDVGETVVVGTSRVQGDKALIVLLTAVPKK